MNKERWEWYTKSINDAMFELYSESQEEFEFRMNQPSFEDPSITYREWLRRQSETFKTH